MALSILLRLPWGISCKFFGFIIMSLFWSSEAIKKHVCKTPKKEIESMHVFVIAQVGEKNMMMTR